MSISLIFCVFVFKQKTAYEMRISDWSSDVCSSDLVLHRLQRVLVLELRGEQLQEIALVEIGLFRRRVARVIAANAECVQIKCRGAAHRCLTVQVSGCWP